MNVVRCAIVAACLITPTLGVTQDSAIGRRVIFDTGVGVRFSLPFRLEKSKESNRELALYTSTQSVMDAGKRLQVTYAVYIPQRDASVTSDAASLAVKELSALISSGEIHPDGRKVAEKSLSELRTKIGKSNELEGFIIRLRNGSVAYMNFVANGKRPVVVVLLAKPEPGEWFSAWMYASTERRDWAMSKAELTPRK